MVQVLIIESYFKSLHAAQPERVVWLFFSGIKHTLVSHDYP